VVAGIARVEDGTDAPASWRKIVLFPFIIVSVGRGA
jgi:hypothetical protein